MLQAIGTTLWTGNQPVARSLATQENRNIEELRNPAMPRVGFEPTIPIFEAGGKRFDARPLGSARNKFNLEIFPV
jgi:hypothetical protein